MEINQLLRIGTGRECKSTAFITLKMAVLAPIPSAIVRIETAVKTGDLARWRNV